MLRERARAHAAATIEARSQNSSRKWRTIVNNQRNEQVFRVLFEGSTAEVADLNDWAVNVVRDYCSELGYNAARLYAEESERIDSLPGGASLGKYLRCKRVGSRYRLTRSIRRAVWVINITRDILRDDLGDFRRA